jgi:hypothetical protein
MALDARRNKPGITAWERPRTGKRHPVTQALAAPRHHPTLPPTHAFGTHAEQHAALEDATRRWVFEGDSPQNVADYAHALRALLGEV